MESGHERLFNYLRRNTFIRNILRKPKFAWGKLCQKPISIDLTIECPSCIDNLPDRYCHYLDEKALIITTM